ncbi:hypothetical protein CK203_051597 [Vitis vinifera]|uniref:Vacuolar protein sorting-associated protein 62 n=1 Tax=Vitis vinifera TaxID=29760 RepID=A0A438HBQ3_VITVI|nr:hypothetical protein CK203_051597 [Vitis vinifera]
MFGCECFCWNRDSQYRPLEPQPFSLPAPIPEWPRGMPFYFAFLARSRECQFDYQNLGQGFATGQINLGEIVVLKITQFERIWSCNQLHGKTTGVTFYKPVGIPDGFFSLGHYCQPNDQALRGYVLVAQDAAASRLKVGSVHDSPLGDSPALIRPLSYTLMWNTDSHYDGCGYFWLPNPPAGYKAMGFVVTDNPNQPALEEYSPSPDEEPNIACLKNLDSTLHAMPNLKQIHALIKHYGATVFFHPDDIYMPSSVPWFFKNGALVYQNGKLDGKPIDSRGSNLPSGGKNDGEFWIDLPDDDDERPILKVGT